jgi:hypothetical protein
MILIAENILMMLCLEKVYLDLYILKQKLLKVSIN